MAPVIPNPERIREFPTWQAFETWLRKNHHKEPEVWIKIHKKASGLPSINAIEAIDVVLCWGWIDGIRKGFDAISFLQRYTPRGKTSIWSQVNIANVERLTKAGRMTEFGQAEVDRAKADGRWARAYGTSKTIEFPPDLLAAIEAEPKALDLFQRLTAQNRFALAFRTHNLKTEAGRKKKIATFVEMLKNGETIYPNGKGKKP